MMKTKRLADPQASPDGSLVAFELKETPLDGTSNSDLWLVPVSGGEPRRLTSHPASDTRPRWSPDGRRLAEAGKPSSARVYDALLDATRTITEVRE
jgi:tricorn protease